LARSAFGRPDLDIAPDSFPTRVAGCFRNDAACAMS
jgi:hypothetical protein